MMIKSEALLQSLEAEVNQIISQVNKLKNSDLHSLTWKENVDSWCVLECLEHLNLYGDFYLPQIGEKIKTSNTSPSIEFKSGMLGNYFAQSMLPKEKLNKMKTFKDKNPLNANLDLKVMDRFLNQQSTLLSLLEQSKKVNLKKVRIATSLSPLIKLSLGDTYRFYVNHMIRHLKQIENTLSAVTPQTKFRVA